MIYSILFILERLRTNLPAPKKRFSVALAAAVFLAVQLATVWPGICGNPAATMRNQIATPSALTLDDILRGIEQRYAPAGFTADFVQESTLKMMEITDFASGKASFQRPGMMRWEYETPERQLIITDGIRLWIYKPEDNQVMLGKADAFFADGSGASFLSNIELIRQKFSIELVTQAMDENEILKLIPKEKNIDLSAIYLTISRKTFDVSQIVSYNSYGDETRIKLQNIRFDKIPDDSRFKFKIPADVDLLYLEE